MTSPLLHVAEIEIINFFGLRDLTISKPGRVNVASGDNAVGKTTILKAIRATVEGAGPECITVGEDRATLLVRMGDASTIRRTFNATSATKSRGTVTVMDGNGEKVASPQSYLSSLFGGLCFNPLDLFASKTGAERRKIVAQAMQVTASDEDWARWGLTATEVEIVNEMAQGMHPLLVLVKAEKTYVARRRDANRDAKAITTAADAAKPAGTGLDDAPSVDDAKAVLEAAGQAVGEFEQQREAIEAKARERAREEARIEGLGDRAVAADAAAGRAEEEARLLRLEACRLRREADEATAALGQSSDGGSDFDTRSASDLRNAEALARAELGWAVATEKIADIAAETERLDNVVTQLRAAPAELLERADTPVTGLAFTEDDITLDGKPGSQLCGREQIELGLQLARSITPSGIICIDGIEALSDEAFAHFVELTEGDGCQYWVTKVTGGDLKIDTIDPDPALPEAAAKAKANDTKPRRANPKAGFAFPKK